jgi:tetratricopeptide (TPR) repeat protein
LAVADTFQKEWPALEKADPLVKVRALIALHGTGCAKLAAKIWHNQPADFRLASGYWQIARLLCQDGGGDWIPSSPENAEPRTDAGDWDGTIAPDFVAEAQKQNQTPGVDPDPERQTFLAFADHASNHDAEAQAFLEKLPPNNERSLLLLQIYFAAHNQSKALELAQTPNLFDARDGERWEILARCLEQANRIPEAAYDWTQAVLTAPDAPDLMGRAENFLASHPDVEALRQAIEPWKEIKNPGDYAFEAEMTQIMTNNIQRITHAPNVFVQAEFNNSYRNGNGPLPIKITLTGELDNEAQHADVLQVANRFCKTVIDNMTIKKP